MITLTETNIAPENKVSKRKVVFQPCIFRGDVSCGGCITSTQEDLKST